MAWDFNTSIILEFITNFTLGTLVKLRWTCTSSTKINLTLETYGESEVHNISFITAIAIIRIVFNLTLHTSVTIKDSTVRLAASTIFSESVAILAFETLWSSSVVGNNQTL